MRYVMAIVLLATACKKEGRKYEQTTTPTSPTAVIDAGTGDGPAQDAGPTQDAPAP